MTVQLQFHHSEAQIQNCPPHSLSPRVITSPTHLSLFDVSFYHLTYKNNSDEQKYYG